LEKVREITQKENIVLIFDEVISGFRVSLGGAQKIFGITPDLTILGKIIGGGYPVGGFGGKREIMDLISPVGNVYHAGTLSGNPISVAAGIETISILKENPEIYENINKKTENLVNKINELIKKYDIPATVNYFGSLFTIFFAKEKVKFKAEQQKWIKDRETKVQKAYDKYEAEEGPRMAGELAASDRLSITKDRALQLAKRYDKLNK